MTTESDDEAPLRRELDHLADLMPSEPARLRSVQRRVRRRRQRRAAGVLTVVAGATVATGALSFRSQPSTVASLAAATTATTSGTGTGAGACPAMEAGTGGGPGKSAPADGATKVDSGQAMVKGLGTVMAVDGDHLTITVDMAVMNQPAPTSESVASPPAAVEAVRTSATGLFAHGAKVDALDTPVGTMVAFAGPVAADGTVTLDSLDAPPEEPAKPTDAGGEAASGTATTGTERMAKGRGTIVALAPDSVQVEVDDGPLAGQTITMPAPAPDPSCTPEVGASVGFEAASSDGGTTWHLVLLST